MNQLKILQPTKAEVSEITSQLSELQKKQG